MEKQKESPQASEPNIIAKRDAEMRARLSEAAQKIREKPKGEEETSQAKVVRKEEEAMEATRQQQTEQELKTVPPSTELADQAGEEFQQLNPEEKRRWTIGIAGLGFKIQELKGNLLSGLYGKLVKDRWEEGKIEADQGTLVRFYNSLKDSYTETSERASKDLNDYHQGVGTFMGRQARAGKGIGFLLGNAAWYGRTLIGYAGETLGNPARLVTLGAMAVGKMSEGMKEARLRGAESIEAARIGKKEAEVHEQSGEMPAPQVMESAYQADIETAAEQAWALYEKAKNGGQEVTKADLEKAYREQLPQDIFNRLAEKQLSARRIFSGELVTTLAQQHLRNKVLTIQNELDAIEKLSIPPEEKNKQKELLFNRYASFLKDVDRMVGEAGAVDLIAFGSGVLEKIGKGVAVGMAIETLAEGVPRLWSAWQTFTSDMAPKISGMLFGTEEQVSFKHTPSGKLSPQNLDKVSAVIAQTTENDRVTFAATVAALEERVHEIKEAAVVHKGEGVEHAFIRQIKLHPEEFGFKGDADDEGAVKTFAETKAHQIALQNGYVEARGYLVTQETRVAKPETSLYVLRPDDTGGATVEVINKSEYTYKEDEEMVKRLSAEEEAAKAEAPEGELEKEEAKLSEQKEESEKSGSESDKETAAKAVKDLTANLNLPESAFAGSEEKVTAMDDDQREALRLVLLWQENPIDRWDPSARHNLIQETASHILSEDAAERKRVLDDFAEMMRKSPRYQIEGSYYDEESDRAYQRLKSLLFEGALEAPAPLPPQTETLDITENMQALAVMGIEPPVTSQFTEEIARLTKSELSALEIASHDFGLKDAGDELATNYLAYTLEHFNADTDAQTNQWIEQYKNLMEADLKSGNRMIDGKPLTEDYIDMRVQKLQMLLLHEDEKEVLPQSNPEIRTPGKSTNLILENIMSRNDQTPETKAVILATQLQNRSLSAENFVKYYAERTAGGATVSKDLLRNLEEIITKANSGTAQERGMAQRALTVISQRLMKDIAVAK